MADGMKLTNNGLNALAYALTGKELKFTRVVVGDGNINANTNVLNLSGLVHPVKELPIVNINKTDSIGTAEIVCEMSNQNLQTGFWVREFGLFAKHPNTGQEILYSYRNVGNEASYLPGDGGPDVINYTLSLVTVIDQAQNVTAVMTSNNQYVTSSALTSRINSLFGAYKAIKGFWTYSQNDTHLLRPAELDDVKAILLGRYDIESLNARITALEDALSQVLLSLEIENLYPDYSFFLAEDFNNTTELDLYKCRVTSIVAGDDSIDCEPLSGIIPGSFYMLTDGVNQELVQADSISIENGIQRVILVNPVQNTYILNTCMLYRTSANIMQGQATGAGSRKTLTWAANETWRGSGANSSYVVNLDTSINNSQNFYIEGSGVINSAGQITLEA